MRIKAGKYKNQIIKLIILSAVLAATLINISCENIAPEDMNMGDLGNILNVIIKDDTPETEQPQQGTQAAQNSETTEFVNPPDIVEASDSVTDTTDAGISNPDNLRETAREDEPKDIGVVPINISSDSSSNPNQNQNQNGSASVLSDALKYFPDMPEAFKYVQFPSSLTMTDSLKQAIKNLDNLRKKDFESAGFYVTTTTPSLINPLPGGGALSEARRYRTQLVEAAYNIDLQTIYLNADDMYRTVVNSVLAGDYISDIVCAPLSLQSLFVQQGLLINLKKMPFMNLDADYYNKSSIEANTIDGEIYGAVSDLTFDPSKIYAVFYNKELLKKCGIENLNSLYENGEWTYDNMLKLCKTLASSVDTAKEDIFTVGLPTEETDIITGMHIPYSPEYKNHIDDFNTKIGEIVSRIVNNKDGISPLISKGDEQQRTAFADGSMLFSIMTLDIAPEITDSAFDWSILPLPVLDASKDEKYSFSFTKSNAICISVLKGVRNTEKCGIITEALSRASYNYMREMYVNDLMTYNLRDMKSANIVNAIINDTRY